MKFVTLLLFSLLSANTVFASEFERAGYASAFLFFGDELESKLANNRVRFSMAQNCHFSITETELGVSNDTLIDYSLARWKSGQFAFGENGLEHFEVSCSGDCINYQSNFEFNTLIFNFLPKNKIIIPLIVSKERFLSALTDLTRTCLGQNSRY